MPQREFETASGNITVKTDSPPGTDCFKQFKEKAYQWRQNLKSGLPNATDQFVEGAWLLIGDYPDEAYGYVNIMMAISNYESTGASAKARSLAEKLFASSAPQNCKLWAKGFLNRLDAGGKAVDMQFIALDGRSVDLKQLRGKVVLVDFWATSCGACVKELPRVKAVWDKFHSQGLEIIGISCDTDKAALEQFVNSHEIPWPQFFDGKHPFDNKYTVGFGIGGVPHVFFVNRNGLLCWDRVRASNGSFEKIISMLLSEQINS
jgi:peroxiredoxin